MFDEVDLDHLAKSVHHACVARGWPMGWEGRGCYLHLESSELIEAFRGKGDSTVLEEAADVLLVLMSITEQGGVKFSNVVNQAQEKLGRIRKNQCGEIVALSPRGSE